MNLRLFGLILALISTVLVMPACVTLSERQDGPMTRHELLLAEFRAEREAKERGARRQTTKSWSPVYRRGAYEPDEWNRTVNKLSTRRALSRQDEGGRFQSLHTEAGWTSSSGHFYQNSNPADRAAAIEDGDLGTR